MNSVETQNIQPQNSTEANGNGQKGAQETENSEFN